MPVPRLMQHKFVGAVFGQTPRTMVARALLLVAVLGTLMIIAIGIISPAASAGQVGAPSVPSSDAGMTVGLAVGNAAPDFTLMDIDGKRTRLSDFRGRPVMLNFWYATCPGCLVEMPGMQRYYASQQAVEKQFVILGVNTINDAQTVRQFRQARGLTYPVVLDSQGQVADLYNLAGTPTSYFIDRQGIVRFKEIGPVDDATLQQEVAEISR